MTAAEILQRAIDDADQWRWGRGAYYFERDGTYCAVGWLDRCAGYDRAHSYAAGHIDWAAELAARDACDLVTGTSLIAFNDDKAACKEDVLEVFRRALASLTA